MKQECIFVLGMHRSGTSALIGSIEEFGYLLGDVNISAKFNKKGNRESLIVNRLNDNILKENKATWYNPVVCDVWTPFQLTIRDYYIKNHYSIEKWALKDPRFLFTFDFWTNALSRFKCVGIFRHPLLVAESLLSRNNIDLKSGLNLWYSYNERLLKLQDLIGFDIIEFDYNFLEKTESLRTKYTSASQSTIKFYDQSLHNIQVKSRVSLPVKFDYLYQKLKCCSVDKLNIENW